MIFHHKNVLLICASCLLLTACNPQLKKAKALQYELSPLDGLAEWSFKGKMALSDGQQGGSGQVTWEQGHQQIYALLKAPLGQGRWSITEQSNGASVLSSSKRGIIRSNDAAILLQSEVGWEIPWRALKSWLMVEPVDPNLAKVTQVNGSLVIQELGWRIEYKNWFKIANRNLPRRITARKEPFSIKLSIKKWNVPVE